MRVIQDMFKQHLALPLKHSGVGGFRNLRRRANAQTPCPRNSISQPIEVAELTDRARGSRCRSDRLRRCGRTVKESPFLFGGEPNQSPSAVVYFRKSSATCQ